MTIAEPPAKRTRRAASQKVVLKRAAINDSPSDHDDFVDYEDEKEEKIKVTIRKKPNKVETLSTKADEDAFVDLLLRNPEVEDATAGLVIEFDKYWPFPLNSEEPTNTNLLLYCVIDSCAKESCPLCSISQEKHVDLKLMLRLTYGDDQFHDWDTNEDQEEYADEDDGLSFEKIVGQDNTEESIAEFRAFVIESLRSSDHYTKVHTKDEIERIYRNYYYSSSFTEEGTRELPEEIVITSSECLLPANVTAKVCQPEDDYFLDKKCFRAVCYQSKFYFYLDLETLSSQKALSEHIHQVKSIFLDGLLKDNYIGPESHQALKLSDTSDYPEAVVSEGFALKLRIISGNLCLG